jgi:hypothetical protein
MEIKTHVFAYLNIMCIFRLMNEDEVIKILRSQVKPYVGIMHQGTFSNILIRYEMGRLKPSTLTMFFNKMGYVKENGGWKKN